MIEYEYDKFGLTSEEISLLDQCLKAYKNGAVINKNDNSMYITEAPESKLPKRYKVFFSENKNTLVINVFYVFEADKTQGELPTPFFNITAIQKP